MAFPLTHLGHSTIFSTRCSISLAQGVLLWVASVTPSCAQEIHVKALNVSSPCWVVLGGEFSFGTYWDWRLQLSRESISSILNLFLGV